MAASPSPTEPTAPEPARNRAFDPEGTSYESPYPVKFFEFESQRAPMRMASRDVPPEGASRGQTVVLLHGKNFGAFAWERTIAHFKANLA